MLTTLLIAVALVGFTNLSPSISAYASTNESMNLSISAQHDEDILRVARLPESNYSIMNDDGRDLQEFSNDFKTNVVTVILRAEYREINGTSFFGDFLQVPNVWFVRDGFHFTNPVTEDMTRFRQILVLYLEEAGTQQVIDAIAYLHEMDKVLVAEPYFIDVYEDDWNPSNDMLFALRWGLRGEGTPGIRAEAAWGLARGNPNIHVGLFETGVQANHPDLRVQTGNFDGGAAQDHGTHVGGTVAAITDNNVGVAGVAQATLRLLNRGTFRDSLEWAVAQGIRVANASFWQQRPTVEGGVVTAPAVPNANNMQAIANFGTVE